MTECCENCSNCLEIDKIDYSKAGSGESIHSQPEGFICTALACDGVAYWMVGNNRFTGMCECYSPASEEFLKMRNETRHWIENRERGEAVR